MLKKILYFGLGCLGLFLLSEMALFGMFFAGLLEDAPMMQTRFERAWGLDPQSVIIHEDGVPHRTAGYLNPHIECWHCNRSVPRVVSEYNEDGMRLDQFNGSAHCVVGVFGDGYTNALEVSNEEIFTSLLESVLRENGYDVNFLNFGLNNGGPTVNYLRYKQLIQKGYDFDHVLMVFNPIHNVAHNSRKLNKGKAEKGYPYLVRKNGTLIREDWEGSEFSAQAYRSILRFLGDYSHWLNFVNNRIWIGKQRHKSDAGNNVEVFNTVPNADWEEAWRVTEEVLVTWAEEVRKEGADFSVVVLAKQKRFPFKEEPGFGEDYPGVRLSGVFGEHAIGFVDLLPLAEEYMRENEIVSPYFGWEHGNHHSPIGHRFMAEALLPSMKNELSACGAGNTNDALVRRPSVTSDLLRLDLLD